MSADGLLEAAFITWDTVVSILALLITLISAYMVVAYVAGARLTRSQVAIVNTL